MQVKKWAKPIKGNQQLLTVLNPLRNYVEKELPLLDLTKAPNRPQITVNLSIGDPTISLKFRTHPKNIQCISSQIQKNNGYTNPQGMEKARTQLAQKFRVENYEIKKQDIYLTNGGSLAIWAAMRLLLNEGDNFLFPSPGFPLALTIAKSIKAQYKLYHLSADNKWESNLEEIQSLIDEKTRFIYVNDPSNPLGSCWSSEHKIKILNLCQKYNLPLVSDQIYERVTYEQPIKTFAEYAKSSNITIFKCSGLTKLYLGPGWRLGWLIVYGSEEKKKVYNRYLQKIFNITLMPNTIMQATLPDILNNIDNESHLQNCLSLMKANKQYLRTQLENVEYCKFGDAAGALYATVILRLQKLNDLDIKNSIDFTKKLYVEENIKVFPGDFFQGKVPFFRLVICCQIDRIKEFVIRLKRFCQKRLKND